MKNEVHYEYPVNLYISKSYDDAETAQNFIKVLAGEQLTVSKSRNGDYLYVSIEGSDEDIDEFLDVYKDTFTGIVWDCDADANGWVKPKDVYDSIKQDGKVLPDESKVGEGRSNEDYLQEVWDSLAVAWDKDKFNMGKGYDSEYECECITITSKDNEEVRAKIYVEDYNGRHPAAFNVVYRYPGDKGVGVMGTYEFQSTDMDGLGEEVFDYFDEIKQKVGESKKSEAKGPTTGDDALKQMQMDFKKYNGKTIGEIAADIRYDVATALDMPADEVDDVMQSFGLDNIYILRADGVSPKAIAQKILKANDESKKSMGRDQFIKDVLELADAEKQKYYQDELVSFARGYYDHGETSVDKVLSDYFADINESKQTEAVKKYYGYGKDDAIDKEDNDFMWQVAYDWFENRLPGRLKREADSAVSQVIDKDSRAYEEIVTMDDYHAYLQKYGPSVIKDIKANDEAKKSESDETSWALEYLVETAKEKGLKVSWEGSNEICITIGTFPHQDHIFVTDDAPGKDDTSLELYVPAAHINTSGLTLQDVLDYLDDPIGKRDAVQFKNGNRSGKVEANKSEGLPPKKLGSNRQYRSRADLINKMKALGAVEITTPAQFNDIHSKQWLHTAGYAMDINGNLIGQTYFGDKDGKWYYATTKTFQGDYLPECKEESKKSKSTENTTESERISFIKDLANKLGIDNLEEDRASAHMSGWRYFNNDDEGGDGVVLSLKAYPWARDDQSATIDVWLETGSGVIGDCWLSFDFGGDYKNRINADTILTTLKNQLHTLWSRREEEAKKAEAEGSLGELIDKVDNMFHYHNKNLNSYQYNTIDDLLEALKSKDTDKIKAAMSNLDNLVHYRNKNLTKSQYYMLDELLEALQKKYKKSEESKKLESLTLKQKELKDMARYGEAEDITTISDAEAKELKKKGIETVGISRGVYGMNGALLRDNEGNKYVITARSSNLFYFV